MHDKTLCGDAGLPIVLAAGSRRHLCSGVEVGARHDNERVATSQFEDARLYHFARYRCDGCARRARTGESYGGHTAVTDHCLHARRVDQ